MRFKRIAAALLAIIIAWQFSACSKKLGAAIRKPEWSDISSYVFTLGGFDTRMMNFDMAIINASQLTKQEIGSLSNAGVHVLGYLAVGVELISKNADFKSKSYYFMDTSANPVMAMSRGSYYYYCANPSDESWRKIVMNRAEELYKLGCDGMLLDGFNTVELFPETAAGYISLIKSLREKYPEMKLVINGGYSMLKSIISLLDGLLFEGLSTDYDRAKKIYRQLGGSELLENSTIAFDVTNLVRARADFKIFALDYCDFSSIDEARELQKRASDFGFVPYCAKYDLSSVQINYLGTKIAKWEIPINISASGYVSGTFLQPSFTKDWTDERWSAELKMLKAAGVDTIILSPVATRERQGTGSVAYPSKLEEFDGFNKSRALEDCLRNCKKFGINVMLDTYFDERWWDYGWGWDGEGQPSKESFIEYAASSGDIANKVRSELLELYGGEYGDIIAGWYFSPEIWNVNISDDGFYLGQVAELLNMQIAHIISVSRSLPLMLCPSIDTTVSGTSEDTLKQQWMFLFSKVNFRSGDILCPKDSVGSGGMPLGDGGKKLKKWMRAYAEAVESSNVHVKLWCNNETFTEESEPCEMDRFIKQLEVTDEFVEKHIAFAYSRYFSPYVSEPFYHEQYISYLRRARIQA